MSFHVTEGRWYEVTGLEGGVLHGFRLRFTTATFVYMTHFAVVRHSEKPSSVPGAACRAGDESDPPPNRGVM